jgi:hypothetical protein
MSCSSGQPLVRRNLDTKSGCEGDYIYFYYCYSSGSVEIEEVDDFIDSDGKLEERGKIGIDLRKKGPNATDECRTLSVLGQSTTIQWDNEEIVSTFMPTHFRSGKIRVGSTLV